MNRLLVGYSKILLINKITIYIIKTRQYLKFVSIIINTHLTFVSHMHLAGLKQLHNEQTRWQIRKTGGKM